jgi:hypothetical protein
MCNCHSAVSGTNKLRFLNHRIMHRFLTGIKRKVDEEPTANCSRSCISKPNSCKYDASYLSLGVATVAINSEERPQCVLRLSISAADSMQPSKLKRHLETKQSEIKKKLPKHFRRKLDEIHVEQKSFVNATAVSSKALLAYSRVSCRTRSLTRSLEL